MATRYRFGDSTIPHFITYSVVQWADALSRPAYKDIIVQSLRYCIQEKGLVVYGYVIMSNHVHLIASTTSSIPLQDIMRDHKKFTSRTLSKAIDQPTESRRNWLLWLFRSAGEANSNNTQFQFWQQDNHPIELQDNAMLLQKLNYIHNNPVTAGIVYQPEHYVYSSAMDYAGVKDANRLPVVLIDF
ncbi:MAG: transposase [Chitinophagaceae bacterium]